MLDAHVAMVITFLRAYGSENVGGNCQYLHSNTFSSILLVAFAQLVHQFGLYVEQRCLEEVSLSSLWIYTNGDVSLDTFRRKPTVEFFIRSSGRRLIFVYSQRFSNVFTKPLSFWKSMTVTYWSSIAVSKKWFHATFLKLTDNAR